jgi:hypothetical protein
MGETPIDIYFQVVKIKLKKKEYRNRVYITLELDRVR